MDSQLKQPEPRAMKQILLGIFALMKPMPGVLQNPSAWSDKLLWIQKHLGTHAHKRLILSHHKQLNRGHYLIDDREKNGAREFEGELIRFGSPPFPDWPAVIAYLRAKGAH